MLQSKNIKDKVYLFSCSGGVTGSNGLNIAHKLVEWTEATVVACTGKVSYSKIGGKYYARKAFDFGLFYYYRYRPQYLFFGPEIIGRAEQVGMTVW